MFGELKGKLMVIDVLGVSWKNKRLMLAITEDLTVAFVGRLGDLRVM